jgi:hypothetical protein
MDWRNFYIIGKLQWTRMTHLDTLNTNYCQKKGQKSNWQFDSRPLKVENCPDFLACRWHATYHSKALDECYNFALNLISIKVMGSQSRGSPWTKWHLVLVLWPCTKYIIRGKVVASPKSGPWWVLWICVCPWFVRAPKCSNYALTNLLFSLCRPVWMSKLLVNLPSPILNH